jgi:hypothetical protein
MVGFITERNFEQAELEFPGIVAVYETLPVKPATFLELLQRYLSDTMPVRPIVRPTAHSVH